MARARRRLGVGLQFGPTGEALFTSEDNCASCSDTSWRTLLSSNASQRAWWRRSRERAPAFPDRIARKRSRACFFCCSRFKTTSFVCLVRMTGERASTESDASKEAGGRGPFRGQDASCTRLDLSLPLGGQGPDVAGVRLDIRKRGQGSSVLVLQNCA